MPPIINPYRLIVQQSIYNGAFAQSKILLHSKYKQKSISFHLSLYSLDDTKYHLNQFRSLYIYLISSLYLGAVDEFGLWPDERCE